jgi:cytochrome o ubiquinol oxidase subunit 2
VPLLIIIFLGFISWRSTHALDPFRRLDGSAPILHIQVVALDWKWLFIYPGQHVASVNELVVPVGTQLAFDVTSNGAMNAFFVPRLGTQIYAMAGMRSQVHLLASQPGTFRGISANFSGAGFPDMRFVTRAVSPQDFAAWLKQVEASPPLDATTWAALKSPSQNNPVRHFADVDPRLFNRVLAAHGAKPMAMTP